MRCNAGLSGGMYGGKSKSKKEVGFYNDLFYVKLLRFGQYYYFRRLTMDISEADKSSTLTRE